MTTAALIEFEIYDPSQSQTVTLRACSVNDPSVTTLDDKEWLPIILDGPVIGISVFDGAFTGQVQRDIGPVSLSLHADLPDEWTSNSWGGGVAKVWVGTAGDVFANYKQIWVGETNGSSRSERNKLVVELKDREFDQPVLYLSYAGTGGLEGDDSVKNTLKPWCLGDCRFVPPVLIDSVRQIYQVHGYGPVRDIKNVFEGGASLGASTTAYTTAQLQTFLDTAPAQGQWTKLDGHGLFRLGSQPSFPITAHVEGDQPTIGNYATRTADMVDRLHQAVTGSAINAASKSAMNTAMPHHVDLYLTEQQTLKTVIDQLMTNVGGYSFRSLNGELKMGLVRFSASQFELDELNRSEIFVTKIQEQVTSAPVSERRHGAEQCHLVHSASSVVAEIAQAAQAAEDAAAAVDGKATVFPESPTPPSNPTDGDLWPDTSISPTILRRYNEANSSWVATASNALNTSDLTDDANLGETAEWTSVDGKPNFDDRLWNFNYEDFTAFTKDWSFGGAGDVALVGTSDQGGRAARIGNNSGNDYRQMILKEYLPYDPNSLYEFTLDYEIVSGSPTALFYAGVLASDGQGSASNTNSGAHYILASGQNQSTGIGRVVRKCYISGYTASASVNGNPATSTPTSPRGFTDGSSQGLNPTAEFRPYFLINYPNQSGEVILHSLRIRRLSGPLAAGRSIDDVPDGVEYVRFEPIEREKLVGVSEGATVGDALIKVNTFEDTTGGWEGVRAVSPTIPPIAPSGSRSLSIGDGARELPGHKDLKIGDRLWFGCWINTQAMDPGDTVAGLLREPSGTAIPSSTFWSVSAQSGWQFIFGTVTATVDRSEFTFAFDRNTSLGDVLVWGMRAFRVNSVDFAQDVIGTGKPELNATVGARSGVNFRDNGGSIVPDERFLFDHLGFAFDLSGAGGYARAILDRGNQGNVVQTLPDRVQNRGLVMGPDGYLVYNDGGSDIALGNVTFSSLDPAQYARLIGMENAADVTKNISSGPATIEINYDNGGGLVSGEIPKFATYRLTDSSGTEYTSGVTWAVDTISGSWVGALPTMTGTGVGQLSINSEPNTGTVELRIRATVSGRPYDKSTDVKKKTAPPSNTGGATSGGVSTDNTLQAVVSGQQEIAVSEDLTATASGTTMTLSAPNIETYADFSNQVGVWNVRLRWFRENGAVDVEVAVANSDPDTFTFNGEGFPESLPGEVTCNGVDTGLTPGVEYTYRLLGVVTSGGAGKQIFLNGTASVTP